MKLRLRGRALACRKTQGRTQALRRPLLSPTAAPPRKAAPCAAQQQQQRSTVAEPLPPHPRELERRRREIYPAVFDAMLNHEVPETRQALNTEAPKSERQRKQLVTHTLPRAHGDVKKLLPFRLPRANGDVKSS